MELTFTNGTSLQQSACRTVAHNLLNLPFDSIPLELTVEFTPDPLESTHNEFAATAWQYGSLEAETRIASVAPNWKPPWRGVRFLQETFAHELGHALFASLPEARRIAIAQMFGADSDSLEELSPAGSAWEDRISEGIAETFKDAFLPQRYRRYTNRTNHRISISRYPEFRALWREAVPESSIGPPLGVGETPVSEYDEDLFAQGHTQTLVPEIPELNVLVPGSLGRDGIWETLFQNLIFNTGHDGELRQASKWEGWVKDGTVLTYSFTITPDLFIDPPYEKDPEELLGFHHDFRVIWQLFKWKKLGDPLSKAETVHSAEWATTITSPGYFPGEYSGGYRMDGEADGGGPPPVTFTRSITVNATNFPNTLKCGGRTYRFVGLRAQPTIVLTVQHPMTEAEAENLREQCAYPWFPELGFSQHACPRAGEPGDPIVLPSGLVVPGGSQGGRVPSRRRVTGS